MGRPTKLIELEEDKNGCWNVVSHVPNSGGYVFISRKGRNVGAHRLVLEKLYGKTILKGKVVMHTCDNPRCVNPNHLRIGTYIDNLNDAIKKGRKGKLGENNPNAKLTNEEVRKIRKDNRKYAKIAEEYEVSYDYIYKIKANKVRTIE